MTGVTPDRNDPRLGYGTDDEPVPQNEVYLVLSEEERQRGFVAPYRDHYLHVGLGLDGETKCKGVTSMGRALSETYAAKPGFYGATYCVKCQRHRPVGIPEAGGEFVWLQPNGLVDEPLWYVGTLAPVPEGDE